MWLLCAPLLLTLAASIDHAVGTSSPPNVLVIMADDQDLLLDSLSAQPNIMNLIADEGVTFEKHYCTVAWCCPSRVSFLTGKTAHNTNVTAVTPPYGGWPKFLDQGLNENYLPVWINEAGISTYYVGKFMNAYDTGNFDDPCPNGWTDSSFLVDPHTYNYFHSRWTNNGAIKAFHNVHTTSVTQKKALSFIDAAANAGEQFFMMVAPVAPHVQVINSKTSLPGSPPRFRRLYDGQFAPRTPDFNPDIPSGASWVYKLPQLTEAQVTLGDQYHRRRLENLAGVDLMVEALIQRLRFYGLLENSYVIYTSDNGFHIGNHRMPPGKRCGYETDINIPLLIRGPGIPRGVNSTTVHSHTDMAPTILNLLGLPPRPDFDGQAINVTNPTKPTFTSNELVNVEFWEMEPTVASSDGDSVVSGMYYNNTYKSLRMMSAGQSFYYSVWCTGEHEFYDMNLDYYQMNNLLSPDATALNLTQNVTYWGSPAEALFDRLDALLLVLKGCQGDSCRDPWSVIFPEGQVANLEDAMDPIYDEFFANQPKVSFTECIPGHLIEMEGPQNASPWSAD